MTIYKFNFNVLKWEEDGDDYAFTGYEREKEHDKEKNYYEINIPKRTIRQFIAWFNNDKEELEKMWNEDV